MRLSNTSLFSHENICLFCAKTLQVLNEAFTFSGRPFALAACPFLCGQVSAGSHRRLAWACRPRAGFPHKIYELTLFLLLSAQNSWRLLIATSLFFFFFSCNRWWKTTTNVEITSESYCDQFSGQSEMLLIRLRGKSFMHKRQKIVDWNRQQQCVFFCDRPL